MNVPFQASVSAEDAEIPPGRAPVPARANPARDGGFPDIAFAAGWNAIEARDRLSNPLFGRECPGLKFDAPEAEAG